MQDNAFGSADQGKEFGMLFLDLFKKGWEKHAVQKLKQDLLKHREVKLSDGEVWNLKKPIA